MSEDLNPAAGAGDDTPNPASAATDGDQSVQAVGQLQLSPEYADALRSKGWTDQNQLAKGYLDLEKQIGQPELTVPGADASDEDRATFWNAIGRPEEVSKYDLGDFKPPEGMPWSDARQTTALEGMHALGLTSAQVQGVLGLYTADINAMLGEAGLSIEDAGSVKAALDKDLPPGSPKRQEFDAQIQRGAAVLGLNEEATNELSMRVGSRKVLDVLAKLGTLSTADGQLVSGRQQPSLTDPKAAQAEIDAMQADPKQRDILLDKGHPQHEALIQKRDRLFAVAHPNQATEG